MGKTIIERISEYEPNPQSATRLEEALIRQLKSGNVLVARRPKMSLFAIATWASALDLATPVVVGRELFRWVLSATDSGSELLLVGSVTGTVLGRAGQIADEIPGVGDDADQMMEFAEQIVSGDRAPEIIASLTSSDAIWFAVGGASLSSVIMNLRSDKNITVLGWKYDTTISTVKVSNALNASALTTFVSPFVIPIDMRQDLTTENVKALNTLLP